jgi:hypothetical protein
LKNERYRDNKISNDKIIKEVSKRDKNKKTPGKRKRMRGINIKV